MSLMMVGVCLCSQSYKRQPSEPEAIALLPVDEQINQSNKDDGVVCAASQAHTHILSVAECVLKQAGKQASKQPVEQVDAHSRRLFWPAHCTHLGRVQTYSHAHTHMHRLISRQSNRRLIAHRSDAWMKPRERERVRAAAHSFFHSFRVRRSSSFISMRQCKSFDYAISLWKRRLRWAAQAKSNNVRAPLVVVYTRARKRERERA